MNDYYNFNRTALQAYYVNGYESAKAFQTLPNTNVLLMDNDNPMIYVKSTNNIGQSSIKAYEVKEVDVDSLGNSSKFVTKDDFNKAIDDIKSMIDSMIGGKK